MMTEKLKNSFGKCLQKGKAPQNGVLATENCLNFVLLAMIGTGILNFRLSEDTKNH